MKIFDKVLFNKLESEIIQKYVDQFNLGLNNTRNSNKFIQNFYNEIHTKITSLHSNDNLEQTRIFIQSFEIYESNKNMGFADAIEFFCNKKDPTSEPATEVLAEMVSLYKIKSKNPAEIHSLLPEVTTPIQIEIEEKVDSTSQDSSSLLTISIKSDRINQIYNLLKEYFAETERPDLLNLLNGMSIKNKLTFKSSAVKFSHVFWYLSQHQLQIATNSRKDIVHWICDNFHYTRNNEINEFDEENVRKSIMIQVSEYDSPIPGLDKIV
ncbi:hypothetical protein [Pedobacter sp.]|jgi:hypothetical protein|uniref:hypothetical protein n=1 Tax=Pedobacter sp. TaxID=1411316 RepID=UPI002BCFDDD0|nr:hypothetical protein [Pedobacter sp.]HWW41413.1 hypothetical protein [Pedobacter sp.]